VASEPVSRLSLHKSTPPKPGDSAALRRAALQEPPTKRDGVKLRSECWDDDGDLRPMREVVWEWRDAVEDNRGTWATFEDREGDRVSAPMRDRFTPERWAQRYAKLNDLTDGLESRYGRRLTTVMLSLTASSTDGDGWPRPLVDHVLDLDESKDAVNTALDRVLDGRRWHRIALPEQHESGYIHWHWAIFVDGDVDAEEFRPVIEAHLRNCPSAGREGHRILPDDPDESAVSVRESAENLPAYLTSYTLGDGGEYGHDPLEAPEERQMMLAVLWATNKRYWRPSDGAQEFMTFEPDESPEGEWELIGLSDGEDGELQELPPGWSGGGVRLLETWGLEDQPPPGGFRKGWTL